MNHFKARRNQRYLGASLLFMLVIATACVKAGNIPVPTETGIVLLPTATGIKPLPTATRIPLLTEDMLRNTTYQGIYTAEVQLTNGSYIGAQSVKGSASQPTVTFTGPYTLGDLNGNGVDDAVVILVESSGGSGSFVYIAAVLNQEGKPENIATQLLGDRVQVQSLAITDGQIIVKLKTQGPNDPMCCPTQEVEQIYELRGNELVLNDN